MRPTSTGSSTAARGAVVFLLLAGFAGGFWLDAQSSQPSVSEEAAAGSHVESSALQHVQLAEKALRAGEPEAGLTPFDAALLLINSEPMLSEAEQHLQAAANVRLVRRTVAALMREIVARRQEAATLRAELAHLRSAVAVVTAIDEQHAQIGLTGQSARLTTSLGERLLQAKRHLAAIRTHSLFARTANTYVVRVEELDRVRFASETAAQVERESRKYRRAAETDEYSTRSGYGCAENGSCYGDISTVTGQPKTIKVGGYYRADGTYVRGHMRSR